MSGISTVLTVVPMLGMTFGRNSSWVCICMFSVKKFKWTLSLVKNGHDQPIKI